MKPARIIVMTVALVAAVAAGYLMLNLSDTEIAQSVTQTVVKEVATDKVLVASNSLPFHHPVDAS